VNTLESGSGGHEISVNGFRGFVSAPSSAPAFSSDSSVSVVPSAAVWPSGRSSRGAVASLWVLVVPVQSVSGASAISIRRLSS
jgi:hypothetical protein